MKVHSSSFIHPGHIRRVNEDSFYSNDEEGLWIVCDGMGGHEEGLFASNLATDSFEALELHFDFEVNVQRIIQTVHFIKKQLDKKIAMLGRDIIIGTTLILLYIKGNNAFCMGAGDSRCYLLRDNKLSLVSMDHTRELVDESGMQTVLTNALYAPGDISVDTKRFAVKHNDTFLLCSDGLYNSLTNQQIKKAMDNETLKVGLKSLVTCVLADKADDNLTGVMVGLL